MRFYRLTDCYSAQIEAVALLNLRFGFTCMGVAYWRSWQALRSAAWGWRNWFPRVSIELWSHTGQNDMRQIFRLKVNRFSIGWTSAGRLTDRALYSARDLGLNLRMGRWSLPRV